MSDNSNQQSTLLDVQGLKTYFPLTQGIVFQRKVGDIRAVDDVSLSIERGKTLGLVGESGSGKTTIARTLVRLYKPTAGKILFDGKDLATLEGEELRRVRQRLQMIFQDPYASLNPRFTIGSLIGEPMHIYKTASPKEVQEQVVELLRVVGLRPEYIDRYPHEFSGGQRQRIAVARALAINPDFIIADEPVSALDVSVRAQVLNLLQRLQRQFSLTYLFVSHDLSVVRHVADRIAVMYLGKIVELADRDELYASPQHPYTMALLSAVPIPDPQIEKKRKRIILTGDLPSPINIPRGCRFHTRCPMAQSICREVEPPFEAKRGREHYAACHFSDQTSTLASSTPEASPSNA
ncbi:ABC transporter ATP-binding protein [Ktedonospora formicarum]|uniref:ABC transporter ATP-binding protein n=1 Tax=Ktedonospora formicarum TaxID=2778364 RepID=A0A8J3I1H7_9CHLR|nr:dipeptide ABC transporter ATP-binding protein [Ktedonospora formicarum]GHO45060.1 ABC transporter ATP-binding protein [Ktedonospora formicarum]